MHALSHTIPRRPIITRSSPFLMHIEILRIVNVFVRPCLNATDHTGLEVEEDGAGDVARIVGLVEEDIFAVSAFGREVFEITVLVDAVF